MSDFMAKVGNGILKVTVTLEVTVTTTIRMPATLYLTVSANTADNTRSLRAYRLLHSWDENQATWNVSATGSNWGRRGGRAPARPPAARAAQAPVPVSPAGGSVIAIPLAPDEVEKMIHGTLPNYGWLLKMDVENNDKHDYDSSSATTPTERPKLVIQYATAA